MTAGQQAGAAMEDGVQYVVTVAAGGGTTFGYFSASYGNVVPSGYVSGGSSFGIVAVLSVNPGADFDIQMLSGGSTLFKAALVQCTDGTFRRYETAAATFDNPGGQSRWIWGTGTSRVFTAAGTRSLILIPRKS